MKKETLVRIGTGKVIHQGYKYEGDKKIYVSCGAVRHSGGQRVETFKTGEVTCKKCMKALEESKPELTEAEELKMIWEAQQERRSELRREREEEKAGLKKIWEAQQARRA